MNNKPLILVVEDDAAVRSLMAVTLDTQGYRYHLARNGAEANAARRDGLTDPGKKADINTDGREKTPETAGEG